jgi:hypothetical protein
MLAYLSKRIAWAIETIKADKDLDKGIQDIDLAKKLGTNKNTLAAYRNQKGLIKGEFIEKLVSEYHFSPAWLLAGNGEPFPGAGEKYPEACGPEEASPPSEVKMVSDRWAGPAELDHAKIKVSDALIMASRVLESGSGYAEALRSNIVDYHRAIRAEKGITGPDAGELTPVLMRIERTMKDLKVSAIKGLQVGDLTRFMGKQIDLDGLLDVFLEKAMTATGATMGSIMIKDPKTGDFRIAAVRGFANGPQKDLCIDLQKSLVRIVVEEKKSLLVQNIETDPRTLKKSDPKYGPPSFLTVPVITDGEAVTGMFNLAKKDTGRVFDNEDEEAMSKIIPDVSAALKKSGSHHLGSAM